MKRSRAFWLIGAALLVGFLAAHWCAAQSAHKPSGKEAVTDSYIAFHQLESFVSYLQDTKQTNILQRFNEYATIVNASQQSVDLGVILAVLQRLRDGRTNEAYELLEGRLSTDLVGFVASYRELPVPLREKMSLKPVQYARDYRTKFPFKHRYPNVDEGVTDAFKILDEKTSK